MEPVTPSVALSKPAFHDLLRRWLESGEQRIGDADFGQTAWIHVCDGETEYRLNSDTRRDGVVAYLELVARHGDDLKWLTVPNRDGRENAVAYGPEETQIRYFYLYDRNG